MNKNYKVCGLDVHKDTIFCAIYDGKTHSEVKKFETFTQSIKELGEMLKAEGVQEIAMESTGIYWIPIWNILEDMGFSLMLVNPYFIKQMPGRKRDVKDAQWIATLLHKNLLRASFIPDKHIRELRSYSRKYVKLKHKLTGLLIEMEHLLEKNNIRITSLVSKIESKSVLNVIEKIIKGEDSVQELLPCIHGRILKSKGEKVALSLEGHIQEHHRLLLEMAYEQYQLLRQHLERLEAAMLNLCETYYKEELSLLQTLPGVKQQAAMQIIAETGGDMSAFENSKRLTRWAGLSPRNDESAGKIQSRAITKGNKYLRRIMVQIAWAASRTQGSRFQAIFKRLSLRKSRKKALIAVARKLLTIVWHLLYHKQGYDPDRQVIPNTKRLKKKIKYHQQQIAQLSALLAS